MKPGGCWWHRVHAIVERISSVVVVLSALVKKEDIGRILGLNWLNWSFWGGCRIYHLIIGILKCITWSRNPFFFVAQVAKRDECQPPTITGSDLELPSAHLSFELYPLQDRGTAAHHFDLHVDVWPQRGHQRLWQSAAMAECIGASSKDVVGFGEFLGTGFFSPCTCRQDWKWVTQAFPP